MKITKILTGAITIAILTGILSNASYGITTKIHRHTTASDFLAGEPNDVIISSQGTIELGPASQLLADDFEDVWSINSIAANGTTVYLGTSPNGGVYKYRMGRITRIYPEDNENQTESSNENDSHLTNEHIFAMATDISNRLLVGISGRRCELIRFDGDKPETVFEPEDAKYIFAIAIGPDGYIYLGTGPEGKIYKLDPGAQNPEVLYDSEDNNILALQIDDNGNIYAGSDKRGLIYMIDSSTGDARVLYHSDKPEITSLLLSNDRLYAAGTSANVQQAEEAFAHSVPGPGRPDIDQPQDDQDDSEEPSARSLEVPNTSNQRQQGSRGAPQQQGRPEEASQVYSVTQEGFVTTVFTEAAVFLTLAEHEGKLLLGTGNKGQLFSIDIDADEKQIIYDDKEAAQISAIAPGSDGIYIGTSNPARLIRLNEGYAWEGVYESALIDADQPAKWGRLTIEGDIPDDCKVLVSSRSSNVGDTDSAAFSQWTEPVEITEPVDLDSPLGRFLQYRLVLKCDPADKTPVIRQVAVSSVVPNLAPKVKSVKAERIDQPNKEGFFNIAWQAEDANDDTLIYTVQFRQADWGVWIEAADELEETNFEWNTKTVPDGKYEIRVTASDIRDNCPDTALTGSRRSDPITVDNTGPEINVTEIVKLTDGVDIEFIVRDELSIIGKVEYTVNSKTGWKGVLPEQLVLDAKSEQFTVSVRDLEPGRHLIALRAKDDVGNTTHKSVPVTIE